MKDKTNLQKNILDKIDSGSIAMKPKIHFTLKTFAVAFGLFAGTILALFIVSFIVFILKGTGLLNFSDFGGRGLFMLLLSLPWLLVISVVILVLLLETLARYFAFVYRKPMVYSILGILLIVVFAGSVLASTTIHQNMYEKAIDRKLPVGEMFYMHYGERPPRGGIVGTVEDINESGMFIRTGRGDLKLVGTTTRTRYIEGLTIETGIHIFVTGKRTNNGYEAVGVKILDIQELPVFIKHPKHGEVLKVK